ncbi:hypothetical protein [Roseicyclus sp.]|uniref:hypothetical protein n=1 Tax=Roseicyclus sp. TaxID=1914329 RepID=UPI003F6D5550
MSTAWKKEIDAALAKAALPNGASDRIAPAPARGDVDAFRDRVTYLTDNGPRDRVEQSPYGAAVRLRSALDGIEARGRAASEGPIFTDRHHLAAAEYETLWLKVNGGRVKCSDLQGAGGGGGATGITDQIIHDIQRLRGMDARIGHCPVLLARGARAQAGRRSLFTDQLMFDVLIRHAPLSAVLSARQWSVQSRHLKTLKQALMALLDAIYGR